MKKSHAYLATVVCSFLLLLPIKVRALECVAALHATAQSECVVIERAGVRGIWFQLAVADELRRAKIANSEYQLQVALLEQRAGLRDWQLAQYMDVINLKQEAVTELERGLEAQVSLAREAREAEKRAEAELSAWYRQPALWFAAGLVVSSVTMALVVTL
jgi:hypothetical protein